MSYNDYSYAPSSHQDNSYGHSYPSYEYSDEPQRYYCESTAAASVGSFDEGREGDSHAHMYNHGGATAGGQGAYYGDDARAQRLYDYLQQGQEAHERRDDFAKDPKGTKRTNRERIAKEIGDSGESTTKSSYDKSSYDKSSHGKSSHGKSSRGKSSHDKKSSRKH